MKDKIILMTVDDAAELRNYLINHPEIDLRKKPIYYAHDKIKELLHNPVPIANVRKVKEASTKKETGIKFLPSDTSDLQQELVRLIGSYKSGSNNTFNEISSITDILRRKGILSV